jgi:hypothetical protein
MQRHKDIQRRHKHRATEIQELKDTTKRSETQRDVGGGNDD